MSKVIVPKEVAEAIEEMRSEGCDNVHIVMRAQGAVRREPDLILKRWAFGIGLGEGIATPDELMSALVNGYEVEKSAEELQAERERSVYRYYRKLIEEENDYRHIGDLGIQHKYRGMQAAVKTTLDTLGIKIEGVNA